MCLFTPSANAEFAYGASSGFGYAVTRLDKEGEEFRVSGPAAVANFDLMGVSPMFWVTDGDIRYGAVFRGVSLKGDNGYSLTGSVQTKLRLSLRGLFVEGALGFGHIVARIDGQRDSGGAFFASFRAGVRLSEQWDVAMIADAGVNHDIVPPAEHWSTGFIGLGVSFDPRVETTLSDPERRSNPPGAYQHDGFYLRGFAGGGPVRDRLVSNHALGNTHFGVSAGGVVCRNLVVFGETTITENERDKAVVVRSITAGPGVAVYFPGNSYASVTTGIGRTESLGRVSDFGPAGNITFGKEMWLSRQFGIGFAVRGIAGRNGRGDFDKAIHTLGMIFGVTATLN
jgi:hypothetical protein